MVKAAQRTDRIVQIGTQQRSGEHYHRAVEMIQKEISVRFREHASGMFGTTLWVKVVGRWGSIGSPPDSELLME
jgi:hypothetical protein